MNILFLILIGLSLSMDTFSLSLSIGSFNPSKKDNIIYSLIVGIFHFILPVIGAYLGSYLLDIISININTLLFFVFLFISIEMLLSIISKEEKDLKINFINKIIYAFSVSLDSLTVGLVLKSMGSSWIIGPIIFALEACFFTYIGLIIGKLSYNKIGIKARILGLVIIIFLAVLHLVK